MLREYHHRVQKVLKYPGCGSLSRTITPCNFDLQKMQPRLFFMRFLEFLQQLEEFFRVIKPPNLKLFRPNKETGKTGNDNRILLRGFLTEKIPKKNLAEKLCLVQPLRRSDHLHCSVSHKPARKSSQAY